MIDVADYKHVNHGPGVALVGDANDYFLDEGEGRPGLLFSRKRHGSGPEGRLREGFARALKACTLLEAAPELGGKLTFATDEILIRLPDRLRAPNDDASFAEVSSEVSALLDKLYGRAITRSNAAPRIRSRSLRVETKTAPDPRHLAGDTRRLIRADIHKKIRRFGGSRRSARNAAPDPRAAARTLRVSPPVLLIFL